MIKNKLKVQNSIDADVDYTGSVTVKYFNKATGKLEIINQHNTANDGLFTGITRMLCGLPFTDYLPTSIMGYFDTDCSEQSEAFNQKIAYASTPITLKESFSKDQTSQEITSEILETNGDNNNIVQYTFVVPFNNIKIDPTSPKKIKALVFYNKIGSNEDISKCATVVLENKDAISTDVDSGILIYWQLKFQCTNANK